MRNKIIAFIIVLGIMFGLFPFSVSAAKVGDVLGDVLYSNIVAYIDSNAIPTSVINGKTLVVVEDLARYGFDVVWNGKDKTLKVEFNETKKVSPLAVTKDTSNKPGTPKGKYFYTDIKTYLSGDLAESFAVNGVTMINFEFLGKYGNLRWDGTARELRLLIPRPPAPVDTSKYATYKGITPAISDFTAVTGIKCTNSSFDLKSKYKSATFEYDYETVKANPELVQKYIDVLYSFGYRDKYTGKAVIWQWDSHEDPIWFSNISNDTSIEIDKFFNYSSIKKFEIRLYRIEISDNTVPQNPAVPEQSGSKPKPSMYAELPDVPDFASVINAGLTFKNVSISDSVLGGKSYVYTYSADNITRSFIMGEYYDVLKDMGYKFVSAPRNNTIEGYYGYYTNQKYEIYGMIKELKGISTLVFINITDLSPGASASSTYNVPKLNYEYGPFKMTDILGDIIVKYDISSFIFTKIEYNSSTKKYDVEAQIKGVSDSGDIHMSIVFYNNSGRYLGDEMLGPIFVTKNEQFNVTYKGSWDANLLNNSSKIEFCGFLGGLPAKKS